MPGQRQPTNLLLLKGKKHFSKDELEQRKKMELSAPTDNIVPPSYLTKVQKQAFVDIACDLLDIGIMSNLDCDALARYIQSEEKYRKYDRLVNKAHREIRSLGDNAVGILEKLENLRDKTFKQCRVAASDLGLTISSRCRLAVPKSEKANDPHASMFGDEGAG